MKSVFLLVSFMVCHVFSSVSPDFELDSPLQIQLQHYLASDSDNNLSERGSINIRSIRTGVASISQPDLSSDEVKALKEIAEKDGFYRVKATVVSKNRNIPFLTFVKACTMVESRLSDTVTVSFDHMGTVAAISLSVPFGNCDGTYIPNNELIKFNTTVLMRHMETGPVPDTASYIQKLEREREARERGDPKDNRSFLAKYWMYILPLVIFVVLSSAGAPDGPAGGNGGGR